MGGPEANTSEAYGVWVLQALALAGQARMRLILWA